MQIEKLTTHVDFQVSLMIQIITSTVISSGVSHQSAVKRQC